MFRKFKYAGAVLLMVMTLTTANESYSGSLIVRQSVTGEVRYDSNALIVEDRQESDFIFQLTPEFELVRESESQSYTAEYAPTGQYYLNNSDNSTVSHRFSLGANLSMSRDLTLSASDNFNYSKESLHASQTGIQTSRADILSNTAMLNLRASTGPRSTLSLNLSDGLQQYEDPALVDTRSDTAGLTFEYSATPRVTLNSNYSFTNFVFDSPAATTSMQSHTARLGAVWQVSQSIEARAGAGIQYSPENGSDYGYIGDISLRKNFQRSSAQVSYTRSVANAGGLADSVNMNENYSAEYTRNLSENSTVTLFTSYVKNRTIPEATVKIDSHNSGIRGMWNPYAWMSLSAGYAYFTQDSQTGAGIDIDRSTFFLNVRVVPYERRF